MSRHGFSKHPLYPRWLNMMARCYCPTNRSFRDYGGRGIVVCDAWHDAARFMAWAIRRWRPGLTLERRNVNGPYSPRNCRWASPAEQARNKRNNVWVTIKGVRMTQADAIKSLGGSIGLIANRRARGKSGSQLTAPVRPNRWVVYRGVRMTITDASRMSGIGVATIHKRSLMGWPEERWFDPPKNRQTSESS